MHLCHSISLSEYLSLDTHELTTIDGLLATARNVVGADAHRKGQHEDRRQDGGKDEPSHSNHLLCGADQLRFWHRKEVQSAAATAGRARWPARSRPPTAQAHALNFTPPTATPTNPRAAPLDPQGPSNQSKTVVAA